MIREAIVNDVAILNHLFQKLLEYERSNYDNNIKDNLNINSFFDKRVDLDNNIILVLDINEKVVGYVYATIDEDNKIKKDLEANIESIFILEDFRNKGYGKKLIDEIILKLKEQGVKYIYIENIQKNETARYLYHKLGFEIFKETRKKEL